MPTLFGYQGVFHWVNGQDVVYENWQSGEPGIPDSFEKCGEMTDYSVFYGKWNDKACSDTQQFICQKGNSVKSKKAKKQTKTKH